MRNFFKLKNFNKKINKLKIRGGFTLVEILISMVITGFMSLILLDITRWIALSSRRASSLMLARDRGERVIAFIEPRILHCALGFSKCRDQDLFKKALGKGTSTKKELSLITDWSYWPVIIYRNSYWGLSHDSGDGVFRGRSLAVVYSRPSGLAVQSLNSEKIFLSPGESIEYKIIRGNVNNSGLKRDTNYNDLSAWCVFPSCGVPFHIDFINSEKIRLTLADSWTDDVKIPIAGELYKLKAERFWVDTAAAEFRFHELKKLWDPTSGYPRESGVLALYIEWRPDEKIFDLYVLTSGGSAASGKSPRPAEWPVNADWLTEFEEHELWVSRASWKIQNL